MKRKGIGQSNSGRTRSSSKGTSLLLFFSFSFSLGLFSLDAFFVLFFELFAFEGSFLVL